MKTAKKIIFFLITILFLTGCETKNPSFFDDSSYTNKAISTPVSSPDFTISDNQIGRNSKQTTQSENADSEMNVPPLLHLGFAGDFNLSENWPTTQYLDQQPNGIYDCISPNLITLCNSFDIFMLNNEFTYSNGGLSLPGKAYTFRANPSRIQSLEALGTDLVLLANNHVYDYGSEAFLDTLSTLNSANIDYVGAGKNLEEACRPVYYTYGNTTIAYVAATRAEKNLYTPEATSSTPGVLRTYDPSVYLSVIKEAKANSDYVIASVHWGTEYSSDAEQYQRDLGYSFIDAGADLIVGSHAHVLQGIEYYKGKPILYNLGNFWFNEKDLYSCVMEVNIDTTDSTLDSLRFIPCTQKNCYTSWVTDQTECNSIYDFEENISYGITIDENGIVSPVNIK